jgi:myo-inositol 2-dehydrogenase/D-chiro-inositol 1-dehydrogenase
VAAGQARLAVGIVGFGEIAGYHIRHLRRAGAHVAGVVTRRPTPPDLRRYGSVDELLPDVQAVTIAVPNHLHAHLSLQALALGKAVFIEKPLCLDSEQLDALERVLNGTSLAVRVGFRLRWNPALRALRDRLTAVRRVSCFYRLGIERLAKDKDWTRRERESGGAFFTLAVHALDLARWLARACGEPLEDLRSWTAHETGAADFPLVARLAGTLPGGTVIEAGADLRGDATFRLDLGIEASGGRYPEPTLPEPWPEHEGAADAEYAAMMADFVDAAVRPVRDRQALAEMLQTHRILLAARAAAQPDFKVDGQHFAQSP